MIIITHNSLEALFFLFEYIKPILYKAIIKTIVGNVGETS